MKLTPRQQTFLDKLFELYRELKGPVHYSIVADKLGVNKFSAYDMLKVLEEKGVAASDYVLSGDQAGPGRSQVVFYPTNKAAQFLTQLRDEMRYSSDWSRVKERILHRLEEARQTNPADALREALSNLPDTKIPLNYCAEMISVLLLNLERLRSHTEAVAGHYKVLEDIPAELRGRPVQQQRMLRLESVERTLAVGCPEIGRIS
jgi:DNA-binding PadR family transcriptional regulator